jgi:hypothetical protein
MIKNGGTLIIFLSPLTHTDIYTLCVYVHVIVVMMMMELFLVVVFSVRRLIINIEVLIAFFCG